MFFSVSYNILNILSIYLEYEKRYVMQPNQQLTQDCTVYAVLKRLAWQAEIGSI